MIVYRDITHCGYLDCTNKQCKRRLTDSVLAAAQAWWGGDNPPIAKFASKPDCYEESEVEQ